MEDYHYILNMKKKLEKKHRHYDRIKAKLSGLNKTAKTREKVVAKISKEL